MKNIYFDFDDTLFHTQPAVFKYFEDTYGIKLSVDQYHDTPNLHHLINEHAGQEIVSFDTLWRDYGQDFLASSAWHKDVTPMNGMVEVMQLLSKKYRIHVTTARQEIGRMVIQELLHKHIPNMVHEIHFVWRKQDGVFCKTSKKEYVEKDAQETRIAFFDDSPKEIGAMDDILPSYLFDPHNLHHEKEGIKLTVKSWGEIANILM